MEQGDGGGTPHRGHPWEGLTPGMSSATAVWQGVRVSAGLGVKFVVGKKNRGVKFLKNRGQFSTFRDRLHKEPVHRPVR